jgi:hypothetical protein
MRNLIKDYKFSWPNWEHNWISSCWDWIHFQWSFEEYKKSNKKIIEWYESLIQWKIITLNPNEQHPKKRIEIYNWEEILDQPLIFPRTQTSWVILRNLDEVKTKVGIALLVSDCAWISFSNLDATTIWIIKSWIMWTKKDIIWNLIYQLISLDPNCSLSDFEFHVSPMMWRKYEYSYSKYIELFGELFEEYGLRAEKYFIKNNWDLWYLNLRSIILDVFARNNINPSKIKFSNIETNSPNNPWPSFRLHNIYRNIWNKIWEISELEISKIAYYEWLSEIEIKKDIVKKNWLTELETKLFLSPYYHRYEINRRLWVIIHN